MKNKFGTGLLLIFGLVLIFFVVNAALSYWSIQTLTGNYRRVARSYEVLDELAGTFSALKDGETGQRGFIITRDDDFLRPYNDSIKEIDMHIDRLEVVTADDPDQHERVLRLREATNVRLATLAENLRMARTEDNETLVRSGRLKLGHDQMEAVSSAIAEIRNTEREKLRIRSEESQASGRSSLITLLLTNLVGLALLVIAYLFIKRFIRERQLSIANLQAAHDQLEERVQQRTEELNDANTELERSNRELQDFAFVASHDLQEPLRKIQAFGDRLKTKHGGQLNAEAADYLGRMQNAAARMHVLINDLLTFSRVTTKAQPFRKIDMNEIARDVLSDLEIRIQQTGGSVDVSELPTIEADPLQMQQLLQNLVGNALKFHREGIPPIIKVSGKLHNNGRPQQCEITVEDNGIGFNEKYLDRIFTPFQRLHGRGEYEGTGIGLAVCRKIVERHGGTLTAKSTPGEGTTFIVTLPVNQDEE